MLVDLEIQEEIRALNRFRAENPDLFEKQDGRLFSHLGTVTAFLLISTAAVIVSPFMAVKILLGMVNSFLWFCLMNVTIHHHHTHHNAAKSQAAKRFLNFLYYIAVPNAPKRLSRYVRAHLNHHARPFHETDVDHHYGKNRYAAMTGNAWNRFCYFLELSLAGAHVPGWEDDHYMNTAALETWNQKDYEKMKRGEARKAVKIAVLQWGLFFLVLRIFPGFAWGWIFPMLLVKNWAHYLGQFQHYDNRLADPSRSVYARTKTFRVPGWLNYLSGGELSGHFLHHLFPEIPYYRVEAARKKLLADTELAKLFVIY